MKKSYRVATYSQERVGVTPRRKAGDCADKMFTIFDDSRASQLDDAEFDDRTANRQKGTDSARPKPKQGSSGPDPRPIAAGIFVQVSDSRRHVCLADDRRIQFEEYTDLAAARRGAVGRLAMLANDSGAPLSAKAADRADGIEYIDNFKLHFWQTSLDHCA